jgi:hypothetical protein
MHAFASSAHITESSWIFGLYRSTLLQSQMQVLRIATAIGKQSSEASSYVLRSVVLDNWWRFHLLRYVLLISYWSLLIFFSYRVLSKIPMWRTYMLSCMEERRWSFSLLCILNMHPLKMHRWIAAFLGVSGGYSHITNTIEITAISIIMSNLLNSQ